MLDYKLKPAIKVLIRAGRGISGPGVGLRLGDLGDSVQSAVPTSGQTWVDGTETVFRTAVWAGGKHSETSTQS